MLQHFDSFIFYDVLLTMRLLNARIRPLVHLAAYVSLIRSRGARVTCEVTKTLPSDARSA